MVNVQINGVWHEFPKGTRLIEACEQAGSYVPRYCYHKKLSSPGNCRMCLIEMGMPRMGPDRKPALGDDGKPEINWMPRPQICCATDVSEGLGVRTNSPLVEECRRGVMEFLLINHPLDCPICDQAGECRLQEFSVEYGRQDSRFLENKVKKPKNVELGPRVTLDDERCILCSRCIRFSKEIAQDDVLGFIDRGSYTTLTAHPGKQLENNYSLNTVDICPVGALTSSDFRFKMRVWFLKETKSFCTSCATGCNTIIGTREDVIYRQTPRENDAVNSCWMCDYGRLNYKWIGREDRLKEVLSLKSKALSPETKVQSPETEGLGWTKTPPVPNSLKFHTNSSSSQWRPVLAEIVAKLKSAQSGTVAIVTSARQTNEELFLLSKLAKKFGALTDSVPREAEGDRLLLNADRNPNSVGARLTGIAADPMGSILLKIADSIRSGQIKTLIVFGEDVTKCGIGADLLGKLETLIPELLKKLKAGGYKVVAMRAKAPVQTLPQYDEAVIKELKLPTVSSRPLSSVVTDVSN
jgi:NADH-quinone oxidoreductase subunit G